MKNVLLYDPTTSFCSKFNIVIQHIILFYSFFVKDNFVSESTKTRI